MKPALIVVDVQNDSFKVNAIAEQTLTGAMNLINLTIKLFKTKNHPVIVVQHINEEQGMKPGYKGYNLPDQLAITPDDIHIQKRYGNAFNKTHLLEQLKKHEVDTVFITGFCAEICVLSTYRGAQDLDLNPLLIRGAIASGNLANLNFVESIHNIVTYDCLKALLK